jgi:hypothetical protein
MVYASNETLFIAINNDMARPRPSNMEEATARLLGGEVTVRQMRGASATPANTASTLYRREMGDVGL